MITCRGPAAVGRCARPPVLKGYCQAHYAQWRRKRPLRPLREYGGTEPVTTLRLRTAELAALLRMAKRQKVSLYEMARRIVLAGLEAK